MSSDIPSLWEALSFTTRIHFHPVSRPLLPNIPDHLPGEITLFQPKRCLPCSVSSISSMLLWKAVGAFVNLKGILQSYNPSGCGAQRTSFWTPPRWKRCSCYSKDYFLRTKKQSRLPETAGFLSLKGNQQSLGETAGFLFTDAAGFLSLMLQREHPHLLLLIEGLQKTEPCPRGFSPQPCWLLSGPLWELKLLKQQELNGASLH